MERGIDEGPTVRGFVGGWTITGTDLWVDEDLALLGRPEIAVDRQGVGSIQVGALQAGLDYRLDKSARLPRANFSWSGFDDMDPVSGRGWAEIEGASMRGKLFIHMGDETEFTAIREDIEKRSVRDRNG